MSQNKDRRTKELFLATLDRPPEERDEWLIQQCGKDEKTLREIRLLLEHDNPNNDPLEQGIDKALAHMPSTLRTTPGDGGELGESETTQLDSELFLTKLFKVGALSPEELDAVYQAVASGQRMRGSDGVTTRERLACDRKP